MDIYNQIALVLSVIGSILLTISTTPGTLMNWALYGNSGKLQKHTFGSQAPGSPLLLLRPKLYRIGIWLILSGNAASLFLLIKFWIRSFAHN